MRFPEILSVAVFALTPSLAVAYPTDNVDSLLYPRGLSNASEALKGHHQTRRDDKLTPLRILPLGASIVWGMGSSDGNGFRKPLRDQLRYYGWVNVNMVGSKTNGPMKDNNVEATSGAVITDIHQQMRNSYSYKANVVLIQLGNNDCVHNIDTGNAGRRMRSLVEELWSQDGWDRAVVILSTLIPNADPNVDLCRDSEGGINQQYRQLVRDLQSQNRKIILADTDPLPPHQGRGWLRFPDDYSDSTHPNDSGFKKMAYIFWNGIEEARDRGWIQEPYISSIGDSAPVGCEKRAGDGIDAGGLTQVGSGEDDGIYYHDSEEKGILFSVESNWDRNQWRFARLFSSERDDMVGWTQLPDGTAVYGVWKNNGGGNFVKIANEWRLGDNCIARGVRFMDINGDGLEDFLCVAVNGDTYASINQGDGGVSPPTMRSIGLWKQNEGYPQERVVLGDIDGDGRGDYGVLDDAGNVHFWRSGGVDDKPAFWQSLGLRFTAKGMGDSRGVRFEDINGDGRDDWLWVSDTGETTTWTNSRSCLKGREGDGLNVAWREAFRRGNQQGPTHFGMGAFGSGLRDRIHFARIYSDPGYFGGLPRLDYVFMEHIEKDGKHLFNVRVWKNTGNGGAKVKADGNKYANMVGRSSGAVDYVWTLSTGRMTLYPSSGKSRISANEHWWGPNVPVMWEPGNGRQLDRRDLHLMDWDGDGASDIVWVDPNNQNRVQLWRNRFKEVGRWEWDYNANPAPALFCPERRGLGIDDLSVRFADITGNGRADYLCIERNGRVWGFTHNNDDSWSRINQFKAPEGRDRANLRWADADGDGRDDMIWTDKFTGDGFVYYNQGPDGNPSANLGSDWRWSRPSSNSYSGNTAGTCTFYHDMDGDGRADQHFLTGTFTNIARTALNTCGGGTDAVGDDSIVPQDPGLPVMPGTMPGGGQLPSPGDPDDEGDCGESCDLPPLPPLPECNDPPTTMDGLELFRQWNIIPDLCVDLYLVKVLQNELKASLDKYQGILRDGYDEDFELYERYITDMVDGQLRDFMRNHGGEYFDCEKLDTRPCCGRCGSAQACSNHPEGCNPSRSCTGDENWTPSDCPSRIPAVNFHAGSGNGDTTRYRFSIKGGDRSSFDRRLNDDFGILSEWVRFGEFPFYLNNGCQWDGDPEKCRRYWSGFPMPADEMRVPNPKDGIEPALDNFRDIESQLGTAYDESRDGDYPWLEDEIVDGASVPVYMLQESIDAMVKVSEMAREIEEAQKKEFILLFIGSILAIVPAAGNAVSAVGLSFMGRMIKVAAHAGAAALEIYGIVEDPTSAVFLLFGALIDAKSLRGAATKKQEMVQFDQVGQLGGNVKARVERVDRARFGCR